MRWNDGAMRLWDYYSMRPLLVLLERLWGSLGASLTALGASLGALGRVLGASWRDLGASWGDLGASLGLLWRSWVPLEWSVGGMLPQLIFLTIFGPILDRSWEPKWFPKLFQIESKNHNEELSLLEPSWTSLGSVWGSISVPKLIEFHWFKQFPWISHFWGR